MKNIKAVLAASAVALGVIITGCTSDADVADENIKKEAEQFKVFRRVVAINGVTDKYLLQVEGYCSLEWPDGRSDVICKLDDGGFIKHTIHLSDNVTVMSEQIKGINVSTSHYKVIFKPEVIIPTIEHP